jgi:hypothetical protein
VLRSNKYNVGTELSVGSYYEYDSICWYVLEFTELAQVTCIKKFINSDWSAFGLIGKY